MGKYDNITKLVERSMHAGHCSAEVAQNTINALSDECYPLVEKLFLSKEPLTVEEIEEIYEKAIKPTKNFLLIAPLIKQENITENTLRNIIKDFEMVEDPKSDNLYAFHRATDRCWLEMMCKPLSKAFIEDYKDMFILSTRRFRLWDYDTISERLNQDVLMSICEHTYDNEAEALNARFARDAIGFRRLKATDPQTEEMLYNRIETLLERMPNESINSLPPLIKNRFLSDIKIKNRELSDKKKLFPHLGAQELKAGTEKEIAEAYKRDFKNVVCRRIMQNENLSDDIRNLAFSYYQESPFMLQGPLTAEMSQALLQQTASVFNETNEGYDIDGTVAFDVDKLRLIIAALHNTELSGGEQLDLAYKIASNIVRIDNTVAQWDPTEVDKRGGAGVSRHLTSWLKDVCENISYEKATIALLEMDFGADKSAKEKEKEYITEMLHKLAAKGKLSNDVANCICEKYKSLKINASNKRLMTCLDICAEKATLSDDFYKKIISTYTDPNRKAFATYTTEKQCKALFETIALSTHTPEKWLDEIAKNPLHIKKADIFFVKFCKQHHIETNKHKVRQVMALMRNLKYVERFHNATVDSFFKDSIAASDSIFKLANALSNTSKDGKCYIMEYIKEAREKDMSPFYVFGYKVETEEEKKQRLQEEDEILCQLEELCKKFENAGCSIDEFIRQEKPLIKECYNFDNSMNDSYDKFNFTPERMLRHILENTENVESLAIARIGHIKERENEMAK